MERKFNFRMAELLIVDLPSLTASVKLTLFRMNMRAALRSIQALAPGRLSLILADLGLKGQ